MEGSSPVQTTYTCHTDGFFTTIRIEPKNYFSWDGFTQLCQNYISMPSSKGEVTNSTELNGKKYRILRIEDYDTTDAIIEMVKLVSFFTVILPLIAFVVTGVNYLLSDRVTLFYKDTGSLSCFMKDASEPDQLDRMKALYSMDRTVIEDRFMVNYSSVFTEAVEHNNTAAIKWLYQQDPTLIKDVYGDLSLRPSNRRTPFIQACRYSNAETIRLLAKLDPTVLSETDSFGPYTGFYYLCRRGLTSEIIHMITKYRDEIRREVSLNTFYYLANKGIDPSVKQLLKEKLSLIDTPAPYQDFFDGFSWDELDADDFTFEDKYLLGDQSSNVRALQLINPSGSKLKTQYEYRKAYRMFCMKSHPDKVKTKTPVIEENWNVVQNWWTKFQLSQAYLNLPETA